MKLRKDEVDAVVAELKKKQKKFVDGERDKEFAKLIVDPLTDKIADLIKECPENFRVLFDMRVVEMDLPKEELKVVMVKQLMWDFDTPGAKSEKELTNEVIIASQTCKSMIEILEKINPLNTQTIK